MFPIDHNVHFINIQLKQSAFFNIYLYLPFIIIFHFLYDIRYNFSYTSYTILHQFLIKRLVIKSDFSTHDWMNQ